MSLTINTNIINDTDQYLLDAKNVKGTYVVVANTTERDGLPVATRVEGTLVYCQADDKFYMYNGSSWVEKNYLTTDSSIAFAKLPTGTTSSTVAIGNHTHSNYLTSSSNLNADKLSSGTVPIARIPTGTTSSTVAIGNHTHSNYLTGHPDITLETDSTSTASPAHGGTFTAVDSITRDGDGHVTKINTKTITLPASGDTDKKTSSGDTSSKIYLVGATSQSTSGQTTYSHGEVYVGTDHCLYSNNTKVSVEGHTHSDYATKSEITSAMIYKGTVNANSDLPASHTIGWVYRVGTAGTYVGESCQVGDMIICITTGTSANNAHWEVVETNDNGHVVGPASAVDGRIAVFDKTSGKLIKDSGYSTGSFSSASHTHSYTAPPSATGSGGSTASTNTGAATGAGTANASSTTSVATGISASDSGHTHSVGAHSHGLNSHKHSVGAHSHGLNSHKHSVTAFNVSVSGTTLTFTTVSETGAASGSTANSTAFDTGAASGSTANSTAFDTGAASGSTANSTAFDTSSSTATITITDAGHSHGYTAPASHTHTYDKMSAHTHSITGASTTTGTPS